MEETLTQPCRVSDEGPRVVKLCLRGKMAFGPTGQVIDGTLKENTG